MKTFELRRNDRNFKVGDYLVLQEYIPQTNQYTQRTRTVEVTYILDGTHHPYMGIEPGFCVMSIVCLAADFIPPHFARP